jgi:hypothetical protein
MTSMRKMRRVILRRRGGVWGPRVVCQSPLFLDYKREAKVPVHPHWFAETQLFALTNQGKRLNYIKLITSIEGGEHMG